MLRSAPKRQGGLRVLLHMFLSGGYFEPRSIHSPTTRACSGGVIHRPPQRARGRTPSCRGRRGANNLLSGESRALPPPGSSPIYRLVSRKGTYCAGSCESTVETRSDSGPVVRVSNRADSGADSAPRGSDSGSESARVGDSAARVGRARLAGTQLRSEGLDPVRRPTSIQHPGPSEASGVWYWQERPSRRGLDA